MTDKCPASVWQGSFTLLGIQMKCHVLDNGQRIVEQESLGKLFEQMGESGGVPLDSKEMERFALWQKGGPHEDLDFV